MITCAYCGNRIKEDLAFCPYCLGQVEIPEPPEIPAAASGINEVILVNRAGCGMEMCKSLLQKVLGYNEREANRLLFAIPVRVAAGLNRTQAVTVAGIFAEKGCQTAIYFGNDQDVTDILNRSAEHDIVEKEGLQVVRQEKNPGQVYFRSDGSMSEEAAAVVASLCPANRVTDFSTYTFYNAGDFDRDSRLLASGGSDAELAKADKEDQKRGILLGIGLAALVLVGSLFGGKEEPRSHQYDRGGAMGAVGGFGKTGSRAASKGLSEPKKKKRGLFGFRKQ